MTVIKRNGTVLTPLFFAFSVFFSEIILLSFTTRDFQNLNRILLFSVSVGLFLSLLISLVPSLKLRKVISLVLLFIIFIIYSAETLLFRSFGYFYPPETVFNMAGDVVGSYSGGILKSIFTGAPILVLLSAPLFLFHAVKNKLKVKKTKKAKYVLLLLIFCLAFHFCATVDIGKDETMPISDRELYTASFDFSEGVSRFGLASTLRLNTVYSITGTPFAESKMSEKEQYISDNVSKKADLQALDIPFEYLKKQTKDKQMLSMHGYFSEKKASEENEYTGIFKGKNLIFICAEALSPYAVSKERTPTLYKLSNEGFVFTDYYQPSFAESTSGGEYALLLGQVPKKDSGETGMSMRLCCDENLKASMPAFFYREGYITNGFHNNSYTYYGRNITHPKMNMNWYACGGCVTNNGSYLDLESHLSPGWPRSDCEMISATVDTYIDSDTPFFTYYLTVSGHNNYSFEENTAARRNKDKFTDTGASKTVSAYLSCQYELEAALSRLINELEEKGILDDTVIALSNDHYPYGLSSLWQGNGGRDYISELYGRKVTNTVEKEKGVFFVWCSEMKEPVRVEKPTCSFDVLPTVLNLFGIRFDSRLFAGYDALASDTGLAFFSNYSWKTEKAEYNAETGEVKMLVPVAEEYINKIHNEVKNRILFSKLVRQKEYFKVLKLY